MNDNHLRGSLRIFHPRCYIVHKNKICDSWKTIILPVFELATLRIGQSVRVESAVPGKRLRSIVSSGSVVRAESLIHEDIYKKISYGIEKKSWRKLTTELKNLLADRWRESEVAVVDIFREGCLQDFRSRSRDSDGDQSKNECNRELHSGLIEGGETLRLSIW